MDSIRRQIRHLAPLVREFGRIPHYNMEAERLVRQLRNGGRPKADVEIGLEVDRLNGQRPETKRVLIAGLTALLLFWLWYLTAAGAVSANVLQCDPHALISLVCP